MHACILHVLSVRLTRELCSRLVIFLTKANALLTESQIRDKFSPKIQFHYEVWNFEIYSLVSKLIHLLNFDGHFTFSAAFQVLSQRFIHCFQVILLEFSSEHIGFTSHRESNISSLSFLHFGCQRQIHEIRSTGLLYSNCHVDSVLKSETRNTKHELKFVLPENQPRLINTLELINNKRCSGVALDSAYDGSEMDHRDFIKLFWQKSLHFGWNRILKDGLSNGNCSLGSFRLLRL